MKGRALARSFKVFRPRGAGPASMWPSSGVLRPCWSGARADHLRDRFHEVKAGRGQVVFIAGEAGIGKSRLVLEFRRALAEAGEAATWLEGRCISFGQSIQFLPFIDQLRENFGIERIRRRA